MRNDDKQLNVSSQGFRREILESAAPALVDFGADWCAPCRAIAPVVEQLARDFAGRAIVRTVDVDEQPELREQFGIRSIPSLLFFRDGEVVDRVVGAVPRTKLAERLEALIEPRAVA